MSLPTSPQAPIAIPGRDELLAPDRASALMRAACDNVERVIRGKRAAVELALCTVVARGHLLIEDLPGVGKTTLAHALARTFDLTFGRIQMTSDLLPSDIVGAHAYDAGTSLFTFKPGPLFANMVLADELNRAPPRTQSALLEAMADEQVTIDGKSWPLPAPFTLIATQNPREQVGTYPLPDSQLDRFMTRLSLGHPDAALERQILLLRGGGDALKSLAPVLSAQQLVRLQATAESVRVEPSLADYVVALAGATREGQRFAHGASTRAALSLLALARAFALFDGRAWLLADDVQRAFVACFAHRVGLYGEGGAELGRAEAERTLERLLEEVEVPS